MKLPFLKRLSGGLIAIGLGLATTAFGQGLTSSGITGVVTDTAGKPLSGATVTAVYGPTNTTATTTTNSAGRFNFTGLPVGGPYTVSAMAPGLHARELNDVQLELGQAYDANLKLESDVIKMEAFVAS